MFPVNTIIEIAQVSVPLIIEAIENGNEKDTLLATKIYCCTQSVNDYYTDDPTNEFLPLVSNFLFTLCGGYAFEAENIIGQGGGGIAPAPSGGGGALTPYPINVIVTSGQANVSTIQNSDWVGLTDLNTTATINNTQFTYGSDYTFNTLTGVFNFGLSGYVFQTGDKFATGAFKPTS